MGGGPLPYKLTRAPLDGGPLRRIPKRTEVNRRHVRASRPLICGRIMSMFYSHKSSRPPGIKFLIFALPFGHPKSRFFCPSCTKSYSVCQEAPLVNLKNSRKHICRPSNAIGCLPFAWSSVWNSNVRSKSPSQSSVNVEKTEKNAKISVFWPYCTCIKMSGLAGLPFEKSKNRSKTYLSAIY